MNQIYSFFKNTFGILLFLILTILLSQFLDYLSPKLIVLGWVAYFFVVFLEGIVLTLINLSLLGISYPFTKLVSSTVAKVLCVIIALCGFIYSVTTPWQFANLTGYSFIAIIWCFTLTLFIGVIFLLLTIAVLHSPQKTRI